MNDPILPDTDKDLQLARALGLSLQSGHPISGPASKDPMVDILQEFKSAYSPTQEAWQPNVEASQRIWNQIASATNQERTTHPHAPVFSLPSAFYRFAAAACLLIAVSIGWYLLKPTQPVLLAEAHTEIVNHVLADGSSITLRPNSQLFDVSEASNEAAYRLNGEAYFSVTHNETRTFSVTAGNAQVSVLGTEFTVSTWNDDITVFLQEGRVELKNVTSNQAVILAPGQSGIVSETQVSVQVQAAGSEAFLDWMNQEIAFTSAPIRDVVKELAFHYDIHIEVPANRAGETITGPIALESLDYVLDRLSIVMGGGQFIQFEQAKYRFESD